MFMSPLSRWLKRFRDDEQGTVTVEAVLTLPFLFWALAATYEFFELHRYNSARDKASYTIVDMISREMQSITPTYMDNAKTVFDTIANDDGTNQLRVSVIKYDDDSNTFSISWSQVRGEGDMSPLTTAQVEQAHNTLPIMSDGEEIILLESASVYPALFKVGLSDDLEIETRIFTSPRFAPQVVWEDG